MLASILSAYSQSEPSAPPAPETLSVVASGTNYTINSPTCVTGTASVTCTPSGGVPPYTYSWVRTNGTGSIVSPTAQSSDVSFANLCPSDLDTGTFSVTVTDAENNTAIDSVVVTAENTAVSSALSVSAAGEYDTFTSGTCDPRLVDCEVTSTSGGTPPYTYQWTKVSGDGSIQSGATSTLMRVGMPSVCPASSQSGVYRVTVTDAVNDTVTADVTATSENLG